MAIRLVCIGLLLVVASSALAQGGRAGSVAETAAEDREKEKESPWLLLPVFSVSPKLGTSVGGMAGYLHHFDEKSRVSMFGVNAQYTSTGSTVGGVFGNASWGEDHHRVVAMAVGGNIKNDYDDYLGTGVPLKTDDELRALVGRYLYRVAGDWFLGGQMISTNYQTIGNEAFDQQVLNVLGLQGFKSTGVGLVVYHDSRDSETMPTRGWLMNANNIAYRDGLGSGTDDFDVYRIDLRGYWTHGKGNVFAVRQNNQITSSAPASAEATIQMRGYKMGQYKGKNMSSIEAEERLRLAERWTGTFFLGAACLYGDGKSCSDGGNYFGAWGGGIQYILKQKEGIVINLEYAAGKADNYGVYLKLGYAF